MPALTLDSNIYLSALLFGGKPLQIFEMGFDGQVDIAISDEILEETLGIMARKFRLPAERIERARRYIEAATRHVTPSERVDLVSDPPDNRIVECAQAARSEFIITGDKHLLRLGSLGHIRIVSPADFLIANEGKKRDRT